MINLANLKRQHLAINTELDYILTPLKKEKSSMDVYEITLHINKLAGLLKMHLMDEDKFLYPNLLNCDDQGILEMTNQYINEMGSLAADYTQFKNKYNTSTKVNTNIDMFIIETNAVIDALKDRMEKEDTQLYRLIVEKNI
jgi:succinate dehydrogenase flavin-adding protein (antitoxin of CptAB toxin-antitoxin module)